MKSQQLLMKKMLNLANALISAKENEKAQIDAKLNKLVDKFIKINNLK